MLRRIFFGEGFQTMWLAMAALLQGIAAIIAFSALRYSMTTFTKSLDVSNYTELDRIYFDLLRTAIEKPYLVLPESVLDTSQQKEYDMYAYMMWNFIESVYDRCRWDNQLRETWYPTIDAEARLHRRWFDNPQNCLRFKPKFRNFINDRYPATAASSSFSRNEAGNIDASTC